MIPTLYRGVGADMHYSRYNDFDRAINARLKARGLVGRRFSRKTTYASTDIKQAQEYMGGDEAKYLKVVSPQPGSVISFVPEVSDLVTYMEDYFRDLRWTDHPHRGVNALISDTLGSVDHIEWYIRSGRMKRAIGILIDEYLDEHPVLEFTIGQEPPEQLATHAGEVWITGPRIIETYKNTD